MIHYNCSLWKWTSLYYQITDKASKRQGLLELGAKTYAYSGLRSTLQVYSCGAEGPWEMARCLQLHDGLISGVDWCPTSNRIVTCSHDCNAFVLAFKGGQWQPDMVRN